MIDPELFRRAAIGSAEHRRAMEHPDLATMRPAAVKALAKEIDATLKPLGYARKGNEWRKASLFGRSLVQIQRSQYGFNLFINAASWSHFGWTPMRLKRLGDFCPELPHVDYEVDQLHYVALHENAAFRNAVATIIRVRVVPWLEIRHGVRSVFSSPAPKEMAKLPLFEASSAAAP